MISEELLSAAAQQAGDAWLSHLAQDYDPERRHAFSPKFQRSIKRLKHRANYPGLYAATQRVAAVFLAFLVGSATWLSVDTQARAAFFGWVKELYESYVAYRFEGSPAANAEDADYRLTWLPEGYGDFMTTESEWETRIIYADAEGHALKFSYSAGNGDVNWFVNTSKNDLQQGEVNGVQAELLISRQPETASAIMWITENNTAFYISAYVSEEDLIRLAESVEKIQP